MSARLPCSRCDTLNWSIRSSPRGDRRHLPLPRSRPWSRSADGVRRGRQRRVDERRRRHRHDRSRSAPPHRSRDVREGDPGRASTCGTLTDKILIDDNTWCRCAACINRGIKYLGLRRGNGTEERNKIASPRRHLRAGGEAEGADRSRLLIGEPRLHPQRVHLVERRFQTASVRPRRDGPRGRSAAELVVGAQLPSPDRDRDGGRDFPRRRRRARRRAWTGRAVGSGRGDDLRLI